MAHGVVAPVCVPSLHFTVTSVPPASRYAKKLIDRLQAILGFSQAEGRDADVEQAFLRVLVTAMVLVYGTWAGIADGAFSLELQIALTCGCITGSAGLWMLYRFHVDPHALPSCGALASLRTSFPLPRACSWRKKSVSRLLAFTSG